MYKDKVRYRELHTDDDVDIYSDDGEFQEPRKRRSKGISIIFVVTCIICLGLAGSFYRGNSYNPWSGLKSSSKHDIRKALTKAEIIPDVIPDFTPAFGLSVDWSSSNKHAKLGNTLKPKHLQSAPDVHLTNPPHAKSHHSLPLNNIILTMTDPDAPSRSDPKWGEFCHWIAAGVPVVNITSPSWVLKPDLSHSDHEPKELKAVINYKPPGPPAKTGKHRYVFLAFSPRNATSHPLQLQKPSDRKHWGTGKVGDGVWGWAEEMGLVPIAANFIYAKNDS